ncbi:MAG: hypothetical protein ACI8W8_000885 [Rhodothermales bacterium]|jgi:hypothetical protein
MPTPQALLKTWLDRQLDDAGKSWLAEKLSVVGTGNDRALYLAIAMVTRKLGRDDLQLSAADFADADAACSGWIPRNWSVDQAARTLLLISIPDDGSFPQHFEKLCQTADINELITFYLGLPLYPHPEALVARACEGIRGNIRPAFDAVALNSPYPAAHLPENAWNQMVLKALFIFCPLHPIQGLDARANDELTRMLCDYAHERWAASRVVPAELFRCIAQKPSADGLADLARALNGDVVSECKGAALALHGATHPEAKALLASAPDLVAGIASGELNWSFLETES